MEGIGTENGVRAFGGAAGKDFFEQNGSTRHLVPDARRCQVLIEMFRREIYALRQHTSYTDEDKRFLTAALRVHSSFETALEEAGLVRGKKRLKRKRGGRSQHLMCRSRLIQIFLPWVKDIKEGFRNTPDEKTLALRNDVFEGRW